MSIHLETTEGLECGAAYCRLRGPAQVVESKELGWKMAQRSSAPRRLKGPNPSSDHHSFTPTTCSDSTADCWLESTPISD